jgi:hypothetical protein
MVSIATVLDINYFSLKFSLQSRPFTLSLLRPTTQQLTAGLHQQSEIMVTWNSTGWVNYVNIELYNDTSMVVVLASQVKGSGSLLWTVSSNKDTGGPLPTGINTEYYLRIIHLDAPNDMNLFIPTRSPLLPALPFIKWLLPRVGTQWQPGQTVTLALHSSIYSYGNVCINLTRSASDGTIGLNVTSTEFIRPIGSMIASNIEALNNIYPTYDWYIPTLTSNGSYQLLAYPCNLIVLTMGSSATISDVFTISSVPTALTFQYPLPLTSVIVPATPQSLNATDGSIMSIQLLMPIHMVTYPLTLTLMKQSLHAGSSSFNFTTLTTTLMAVTQTSVNGELFGYATFEWIVNGGDVCILPRRKSSVYSLRVTSNYPSFDSAISVPFSIASGIHHIINDLVPCPGLTYHAHDV